MLKNSRKFTCSFCLPPSVKNRQWRPTWSDLMNLFAQHVTSYKTNTLQNKIALMCITTIHDDIPGWHAFFQRSVVVFYPRILPPGFPPRIRGSQIWYRKQPWLYSCSPQWVSRKWWTVYEMVPCVCQLPECYILTLAITHVLHQARSQGGAGGATYHPKSAKRSTFSDEVDPKVGFL